MPRYEYQCTVCRRVFEITKTISQHDRHQRPPCPKCHSKKTEPRFSVFQAVTSKKT